MANLPPEVTITFTVEIPASQIALYYALLYGLGGEHDDALGRWDDDGGATLEPCTSDSAR